METQYENMWINRKNAVFHDLWQEKFRMGSVTFVYPRTRLHKTEKSDTKFRKAIAVEKPLAAGSPSLSSRNSYRTISIVFGIRKSTIPTIY